MVVTERPQQQHMRYHSELQHASRLRAGSMGLVAYYPPSAASSQLLLGANRPSSTSSVMVNTGEEDDDEEEDGSGGEDSDDDGMGYEYEVRDVLFYRVRLRCSVVK